MNIIKYTTKLSCIRLHCHRRAVLYVIEPDGYGAYEVKACIHNEILLWLFDPNIDPIIQELKALYTGLKPYKAFPSAQDCINYYLEQFIHIYKNNPNKTH